MDGRTPRNLRAAATGAGASAPAHQQHAVRPVFTDVPARVAKQILDLAMRFGTNSGGPVRVEHHHAKELAQLVGSSRETVNKALSDFTQRGWIRQQGKALIIDQPAKLARRARA